MHPIRRRKKRPNYGVRTVEVCRGKNGFGFTISGQQPCILSCIVTGSPAEKAGLRPGDYLVAVNGQNVSKVPHDDVVRLIGGSSGILKLQIAENYYSDSSDEDVIAPARPKPKYPHKPRSGGQHHRPVAIPQQNRAAKVVRDLRTGAMFEEHQQLEVAAIPSSALIRPVSKPSIPPLQRWEPPVPFPVPPPRLYPHPQVEKPRETERVEYQALVGYLGTIEMPKELQPGSRLQVVRGCIRRLRAEKRAHTLVLMSVHSHSLTLKNCHQAIIAEYPAERVTFCGSSSDDEHRFFGLVTAAIRCVDDENDSGETIASSSCHVFAIELRLHGAHSVHAAKAEAFKLNCKTDPATGLCSEFPSSSDPVIAAIKVLYSNRYERGNVENEEPLLANSPQPSNASSTNTTTSSNSDSGIGFRDDCGNQSDRILMVDVQNQRLHIQQVGEVQVPKPRVYELAGRVKDNANARLTVRAMPDPAMNSGGAMVASSRSRSPLSSSSCDDGSRRVFAERVPNIPAYSFPVARSNDDMSVSSGTNRSQDHLALPYKPEPYETVRDFHPHFSDKLDPECYSVPGFSGLCGKGVRSTEAMSISSAQSQDPLLSYKLSPKVFGLPRPVTHSLEDLKVPDPAGLEDSASGVAILSPNSQRGQQWGSLQELRSFVANCFEASPVPEHLHSDQESTSLEQEEPEKGVASWATAFEKLLEDSAGLHTFAEFLKKEFSHENIYFWVACERYRELKDESERKLAAKEIFERHLCLGALEPVNVDSHARQVTQDGLEQAPETLFVQAQKQIFDLMKFDSYPRFIKSELYKECLLRQLSGQELPYTGGEDLDSGLQLKPKAEGDGSPSGTRTKLKKSRSDAEDRRRKSLLPWHRKNRSKSKDRGESEYNKMRMINQQRETEDAVSVRSDVTSSRSSLASWDLALRGSFSRQSVTSGELGERETCTLCRVILADGATTVVQTRKHENVKDMVKRLLDKRGLHYSSFEVYVGNSTKPVPLDEESSVLGGKEVQVEQKVSFRLDLPNRKTVGVKAKSSKSLGEVLRPILHKYGYNVELVTLCLMSENEVLELNLPVLAVDNQRLQVLTRSAEVWKNDAVHKTKSGPTLDEITNRVFEELLQGKAEGRTTPDQGSVRSEDWGSEHSSGIFGRFLRRDSGLLEKSRDARGKSKKSGMNKQEEPDSKSSVVTRAPLIAKWKVGVKLQGRSESDELYEGLKRAQRSRLEDQRGTEINFELPDFLKVETNSFRWDQANGMKNHALKISHKT
ncbi:regulator of G-protein signaling loco isoform X2 [Schistocerca nitens]|uniref:regulator of G-protein signaling loco isoform X2 n=1 Tax=Schistocerca nitens TaxID=7011 RepID=UPI00211928B8|nr:regulator of G-protein signaling loco isoform X2 [Schistocerca nitens]